MHIKKLGMGAGERSVQAEHSQLMARPPRLCSMLHGDFLTGLSPAKFISIGQSPGRSYFYISQYSAQRTCYITGN